MNRNSLLKNLLAAFSAQSVAMAVSALMSLILPKMMGVTEFGYWQLFIFYTGYSGFFHFGLNDGIYLREGGNTRNAVDKKSLSSQFIAACMMQILIAFCISLAANFLYFNDLDRYFVLLLTAIYTCLYNLSGMLGYIFQALNETRLFSFSIMLDRLVFLLAMLVLMFIGTDAFQPYIIAYTCAKAICLVYCLLHAKEFFKQGLYPIKYVVGLCASNIRLGCPLMLATVADGLVIGISRMLIDVNWGINTFGKVSFALSLISFFTAFVTQVAMVLFPALRQSTNSELIHFYQSARDAMEVVFPAAYILYFPMVWLVGLWLPQYSDSLHFFAILLPYCIFNAKMNICSTTFFKVLNHVRELFFINVVTVLISAILSAMGIYVFQSIDIVLIGVTASVILRSLVSELWINKKLGVKATGAALSEIILSIAFVTVALLLSKLSGLLVCTALYGCYLIVNRNAAHRLTDRFHR